MTVAELLGAPGLRLGIGGARWSLTGRPDPDGARATLHAALDAGIRLIDTARAYAPPDRAGTTSEQLIAAALAAHPYGPDAVVATKGGHWRAEDGTFPVDARPETLRAHCRASLRALRLDRIELFQLHWPDPAVPLSDSVAALAELRAEGLVARIGLCNVSLDQVIAAESVTVVDAVQNQFSPLRRDDQPVLDHCTAAGIAYLAYSPLSGPDGAANLGGCLPAFAGLATRHGVSVHELALTWLLAQSPVLVPIVGAGRPEHAVAAARAATVELSPDELALLDGSPPGAQAAGAS